MKKGLVYSRANAVLCTVAACSTISIALVRHELDSYHNKQLRIAKSSEANLSQQTSALSGYGMSDLKALRSRVSKYRSLLGSKDTWDEMNKEFGGSWSIEDGAKHDEGTSITQSVTLRMKTPNVGDWEAAIDAVGTLGHLPGVIVEKFEMKTSGDLEHRSVELIVIVVTIHVLKAPSLAGIQ